MKFKKIKDVTSVSGASFIAAVVFGIFWFFLATILNPEEYGNVGYLLSIVQVGVAFALLGLRYTVTVYEAKGEKIFPASFVIVLISSTIVGIISFVFVQNIFLSILIVGLGLFFIIQSFLQGKEKYKTFSRNQILRAVISVFSAFVLYQILGINGILLGYFIGTLFILKEIYPLIQKKNIDFTELKSKIKFTIPAYAFNITEIVLKWGDKLIIGTYFSMTILGNYHFAFQFFLLLNSIPRGIIFYLIPQEAKNHANKQLKILVVSVTGILALIAIFVIPFVINSILSQYRDSILPIQILLIAIIPFAIDAIQRSEFYGREESRFVLLSNVIHVILYFALIFWLGNEFGLMGLSVGFLISAVVRTGVNTGLARYFNQK